MSFVSNTGEPVQEEQWQWYAALKDGSVLRQFDYSEQEYHYFGEINHSEVVTFGMFNPQTGKTVQLDIPSDAKLIHFYDNILQKHIGGGEVFHRLYCFGYEVGKTKKIYTILPSDFIVEADSSLVGAL